MNKWKRIAIIAHNLNKWKRMAIIAHNYYGNYDLLRELVLK
jgi:hypothetical protein